MVFWVIIGLIILIIAMTKYLIFTETFLIALIVALSINTQTSGIHLLFRILIFLISAFVTGSIVYSIFSIKVGFWILSVCLSIFWAWIFGSWCWQVSYGDMIWTVFVVILSLGGSIGLHIYGAKDIDIDID